MADNPVYPELPVLITLREAFLCPVRNIGHVAITALISVVIVGGVVLALGLWMPNGHSRIAMFAQLPGTQAIVDADVPGEGGSNIVVPSMIKVIVASVVFVAVNILVGVGFFNYWIRMAAMGPGHLSQGRWKTFLKSLFPSAMMIFFAGLLIGVIAYGLVFVLSLAGLMSLMGSPSLMDAIGRLAILAAATSLIFTFIYCYVFAHWSTTLVEIALDQHYVSSSSPRRDARPSPVRMALVLMAIVVATQVLFWLVELLPGGIMVGLAAMVIFTLSIAVVGAAHGTAFRLSTGRTGPLPVTS